MELDYREIDGGAATARKPHEDGKGDLNVYELAATDGHADWTKAYVRNDSA